MVLSDNNRRLLEKRKQYLQKKNMTIRDFADSVGIDYGSCYRWMSEPRRLHRLYAERVLQTHPQFPVK